MLTAYALSCGAVQESFNRDGTIHVAMWREGGKYHVRTVKAATWPDGTHKPAERLSWQVCDTFGAAKSEYAAQKRDYISR